MNCFPFFAKSNQNINAGKTGKALQGSLPSFSMNKTTIKEICFTDIVCDTHPFVWYYYPDHNLAIWTSNLAGAAEKYSPGFLLKQLSGIPGITINDGDAAIKDVNAFRLSHQMISIRNSESCEYIGSSSFSMS